MKATVRTIAGRAMYTFTIDAGPLIALARVEGLAWLLPLFEELPLQRLRGSRHFRSEDVLVEALRFAGEGP